MRVPISFTPNESDTIRLLSVRSLFTFSMDHEIETGVQFFAPNDLYTFSSFVFAIEKSTNKSIPIISFEIGSSGSGDFGTTSEVVPSANQFTYTGGSGPTTVNVDSHTIFASVGRSVPARALTYSMFAINWVLAVCSIITTSVSFNRGNESTDFGITLLPVTVILTIPAIRNLYVGAPPFGIFLGTYKYHDVPPSSGLTVPFRRGWVFPANVDSGIVYGGSVVRLCGKVRVGERC